MRNKKTAYIGLLVALAFIFSYIEFLIPINLGIPGVKLGLANLVIIVGMYTIGEKNSFILSMVRIVLVAITFSNMSAMLYSLAGGILSYAVMVAAKRTKFLSVKGVSAFGGIFHNVGQILAAVLILETKELIYYLPVLMIAGIVSGTVIGLLAAMVIERIKKVIF